MPDKKGGIDWLIFLPVAALMLFGIAFVYSAGAQFSAYKLHAPDKLFLNHTFRIIAGLIVMIVFAKIDYKNYGKISKYLLFIAALALLFTLVAGIRQKGASRWIDLGFMMFQTSELAKYALVIHLAYLISAKQSVIKDFKEGMLPLLAWTGLIAFLILLQPDHSTTLAILTVALSMMFVGNANILHLLGIGGLSFVLVGAYAVTAKYPLQRISAFFGSSSAEEADRLGYQLNQALIALGAGGFFGVGPGLSSQSKDFVPEPHGDFIFSIIGEEYGFIGLLVILATYAFVFWRGTLAARRAPDNFGYLLAFGILTTFGLYALVHAGVNVGLLPTTGVPLPFVSYGGTATLFNAAAIGILLNISSQSKPADVAPQGASVKFGAES